MNRLVCICAGLAVLLIGSAAAAGDSGRDLLAKARAAHFEVDYTRAGELLDRSLRAGDHDRASLAELYQLSGRIAAAFGDVDEAYAQYRRMLILDPDGSLPGGLAPKIVAPFERARAAVGDAAGIVLRVARATETTLTIAVASDPLGMVFGVEASFGDRTSSGKLDGDVVLIVIPARAGDRARIRAVDRFGNELAELDWHRSEGRRVAPGDDGLIAAVQTGEPPVRASGRPLYARWQLWGAAAVGSAAAAVYFGLRARRDWDRLDAVIDDSPSHDFEAAKSLERSGRRSQLYSNIGAATALGLAGVSLYLRLRGDADERAGLGAGVGPDGATISWSGSF